MEYVGAIRFIDKNILAPVITKKTQRLANGSLCLIFCHLALGDASLIAHGDMLAALNDGPDLGRTIFK